MKYLKKMSQANPALLESKKHGSDVLLMIIDSAIASSYFDIPDMSWLDISAIATPISECIGEFVSGIFDSL
jgi:hypothetical protein